MSDTTKFNTYIGPNGKVGSVVESENGLEQQPTIDGEYSIVSEQKPEISTEYVKQSEYKYKVAAMLVAFTLLVSAVGSNKAVIQNILNALNNKPVPENRGGFSAEDVLKAIEEVNKQNTGNGINENENGAKLHANSGDNGAKSHTEGDNNSQPDKTPADLDSIIGYPM